MRLPGEKTGVDGSRLPAMFVTFEGPDGAGKSTALRAAAETLRGEGHTVVTTRQPGHCSIGADVRRLLLEGASLQPSAEMFLYLADRAQNVAEVIRPSLEHGMVVLCDRYSDSTVVYQGHARGLDIALLRNLNEIATGGLQPDLTLLLDLPPEAGLGRLERFDRLDGEPLGFHQAVREGFLVEARRQPERWQIVDASQNPEAVAAECAAAIRDRLREKPRPSAS